jgi:hypothetical protein
MTVNERLHATGRFDDFYRMAARRELGEARRVLESIFVDEAAIAGTLANIAAYGTAHDPTLDSDGWE